MIQYPSDQMFISCHGGAKAILVKMYEKHKNWNTGLYAGSNEELDSPYHNICLSFYVLPIFILC
jgi:hypothetical protein